jgi:hypothetical protein
MLIRLRPQTIEYAQLVVFLSLAIRKAHAFVVVSIKSFEVGKTPIFAITAKDGGETPAYHVGVIFHF